ncbi:MAG TPA: hypothetical protein VF389_10790, partial [Woeseiaceae bacterium]
YGVVGPGLINTARPADKVRDTDLRTITVVDANTIEINAINAAAMPAYVSGGHLQIRPPLDLSQFVSARMQINSASGELLAYYTTDNALEIDQSTSALWLRLTAAQSRDLEFDYGLFDIELLTSDGRVINIAAPDSTITVVAEQTTNHA